MKFDARHRLSNYKQKWQTKKISFNQITCYTFFFSCRLNDTRRYKLHGKLNLNQIFISNDDEDDKKRPFVQV